MYIVIQQINNVVYTCAYLSFISMTNKSGLTFFLSIKYLSVCLPVGLNVFLSTLCLISHFQAQITHICLIEIKHSGHTTL